MSAGKGICLVCGEPLAYFKEAQDVTCQICGKKETGHSVCVEGHYVCDACHRAGGVEHIMAVCRETDSKNPIRIAQKIMSDKSIYPNGPEHHTLIGASLMAAYKNAGGDIDLDKALAELQKLRAEAIERFGLIDARIVHRLGTVHAGDNIVFIATGAEHRAPALDACRWLIDELKERVPIWKKEITPGGEAWVTPHP